MIAQDTAPLLSEDAVYHVIAANPESVSRESLSNFFGLKSKDFSDLDKHINALVRDKKIMRTPESVMRYQAAAPLSDLVIARVADRPARGRAALRIENLNFELPVPVTISEKQMRAYRLKQAERILVILERHKGAELKAKFVSRLNRDKQATIVGKFNDKAGGGGVFQPLDKRIRTSFRAVGNLPAIIDHRVPHYGVIAAGFDPHKPEIMIGEQKWDPVTGSRIYDVIGSNHGLSHRHDKPAAQEAKKVARRISLAMNRRGNLYDLRDLTESRIMVVDPVDARDHDDGILVQRIPGGFYTLAVVTDVPRYVRSGTALDEAARARGFSHYFPDETFHMLPPVLSTNACSLAEGKLRPVAYVEQLRDVDGTPYDTRIGFGYIRNQRQMSYGQFQQFLIDGSPEAFAYRDLQSAIDVRRYHEEIQMESTSTDHRYSDAQLIVQALMVDANKAIAEFLDERDVPFYRRAHAGHVNPMAYKEIADEFAAMGYAIPDFVEQLTPAYINGLIGEAAMRDEKEKISSMIRLRLLEPAHYTLRPLGHWGVSASQYGHFTSPIRRYGDIDNLRALHTAVGGDEFGLTMADEERMERTAAQLNHLQVVNRTVQHETQKYYAVMDLHRQENNSVVANLIGVRPGGIEIFLPASGLRKLVPAHALPSGWRMTDNGRGITDGEVAILQGARIRVKITDVQPHKATWEIGRLEPLRGQFSSAKTQSGQRVVPSALPMPYVA